MMPYRQKLLLESNEPYSIPTIFVEDTEVARFGDLVGSETSSMCLVHCMVLYGMF
jgi:hypothetical protein